MPDYPGFTLHHEGPLTYLTLSRPEARNALNAAMWLALPEILSALETRAETRVLILQADGEVFSAGADIREFAWVYETPERAEQYSASIRKALNALSAFPRPTLASIQGPCIGGGLALALSCDLRFASTNARFAITPAKLGLVYPFADTVRLVNTIGIGAAKDMLFSARNVSGDEALTLGLIHRLTELNDLKAAIHSYGITLSHQSTQSLSAMKSLIALIEAGQVEETDHTHQVFQNAFTSADFKEGYQAFLEKRPAQFFSDE